MYFRCYFPILCNDVSAFKMGYMGFWAFENWNGRFKFSDFKFIQICGDGQSVISVLLLNNG